MSRSRNEVDTRLRQLAFGFSGYLEVFDEDVLHNVSGHSEYYLEAVKARLSLGTTVKAISDEGFIDLLREALLASGIGVRGTHLVSDDEFRKTILENGHEISCLEDLHIDDPSLDLDAVAPMVWRLIDATRVLENEVALVPSSKVLHLLLPDLIVPMDRLYTRTFFRWPSKRFQAHQRRFFDLAFRALAQLAREVLPAQYVGGGWRTCRTKILDNALIGYCRVHSTYLP